MRPVLEGDENHRKVADVDRYWDGNPVCLSIVIVDPEIQCSPPCNAQTTLDSLALVFALLLIRSKMFPIRGHTVGGEGVDTESKRIGVETDGLR